MSLFRKLKHGKDKLSDVADGENIISTTLAPSMRMMHYQVANLQGVGARERQEDSFTISNAFDEQKIRDNGLLFAVCDGMGGMKDGKVASDTAVSTIRQNFQLMNVNMDIAGQLRESIFEASNKIEGLLEGQGGSTAIVCVIYQEKLYYIGVGDSFLYLKRGNNLYRINQEHTMCNQIYLSCIREGNMDPQEARTNPEKAALTQFLGMCGLNEIDGFVKPMPLKDGDVLLACSDGVGGVLSENEMIAALNLEQPNDMCTQIEAGIIAHNKKNQDNYTAIIVKCTK